MQLFPRTDCETAAAEQSRTRVALGDSANAYQAFKLSNRPCEPAVYSYRSKGRALGIHSPASQRLLGPVEVFSSFFSWEYCTRLFFQRRKVFKRHERLYRLVLEGQLDVVGAAQAASLLSTVSTLSTLSTLSVGATFVASTIAIAICSE